MRSELSFPLMAKEADSQTEPRLAQVHIASKWENWESYLGPVGWVPEISSQLQNSFQCTVPNSHLFL